MLLPWVLGFIGFTLGPVLASLALAFTAYNVFTPPRWIGLENIRGMVNDPLFWRSWMITAKYSFVGTLLSLGLALAIALLIFHARRAGGFWRVVYYFPTLLAGASEAFIMSAVWDPDYGLVNSLLKHVGISGPAWLTSTTWALPTVTLVRYWTIGTLMLLFMGARASVPSDYYEAAEVDGAGALRMFRHITLPMISPIVLLNLILGMIGSLQTFAQIYILTKGGPQNSTNTISIYLYQKTFQDLRIGYGSAVSWTLFLVCFSLTAIVLVASRRFVYYGDEGREL